MTDDRTAEEYATAYAECYQIEMNKTDYDREVDGSKDVERVNETLNMLETNSCLNRVDGAPKSSIYRVKKLFLIHLTFFFRMRLVSLGGVKERVVDNEDDIFSNSILLFYSLILQIINFLQTSIQHVQTNTIECQTLIKSHFFFLKTSSHVLKSIYLSIYVRYYHFFHVLSS